MNPAPMQPAPIAPQRNPRVSMDVYAVTLVATRRFDLPPYSGTTLRGAIGRALRATSCSTGYDDCSRRVADQTQFCSRVQRCPYGQLYESAPPLHVELKRGFANPPAPYVVVAPWHGQPITLRVGDELTFRIKLFGAARSLWASVVQAAVAASVRGLGRHENAGAVEVREVVRAVPGLGPQPVYAADTGLIGAPMSEPWRVVPTVDLDVPDTFRVVLSTPLSIERRDESGRRRPLDTFDPRELTSSLARRLELLSLVHEDHLAQWDVQRLLRLSDRVVITDAHIERIRFDRFSSRQDGPVPAEGIAGAVMCARVEPELAALWSTAAAVHVGHGTVFGFGEVLLEPV